jgi:hypothetical protein
LATVFSAHLSRHDPTAAGRAAVRGSVRAPVFSDADLVGRLAGRRARFGGGVIDVIVKVDPTIPDPYAADESPPRSTPV